MADWIRRRGNLRYHWKTGLGWTLVALLSASLALAHDPDGVDAEAKLAPFLDGQWRFDTEPSIHHSHNFESFGSVYSDHTGMTVPGHVAWRYHSGVIPYGLFARITLAHGKLDFRFGETDAPAYAYLAYWMDASACHAYLFNLTSDSAGTGEYWWGYGQEWEECWQAPHGPRGGHTATVTKGED